MVIKVLTHTATTERSKIPTFVENTNTKQLTLTLILTLSLSCSQLNTINNQI